MDCLCGCGKGARLGKSFLPGHNSRNHKPWNKGLTKETDKRVAEYGKKGSETIKRKFIGGRVVWNKGLTKEVSSSLARISLSKIGKPRSAEVKEKCRLRKKLNWQDPEYVRKQMRVRGVRPNRLEIQAAEGILTALGFEYVGDGQLIIGGKCPDFWNRDHKLIEIYGDYWHSGEDPQNRIDFFKQLGYDTLIVWEHEFEDMRALDQKIITYSTARVS